MSTEDEIKQMVDQYRTDSIALRSRHNTMWRSPTETTELHWYIGHHVRRNIRGYLTELDIDGIIKALEEYSNYVGTDSIKKIISIFKKEQEHKG